jgi:ABC-type multidrug transport system ATPase subunit
LLDIRDLTHVYGAGPRALDGVDLSIAPGLFGLLGPNGAGKSTLMRCLATVQAPTGGSIRFDGIDVLSEPDRLRRILGYLPQDFGVYPGVSARLMLDHMAVLKGIASSADRREVVGSLLVKVNLWAVRDRPLAGLSGGMRQRFGVAQALIGAPRLIILDEPTAGLDPEERGRFLDLLAAIAEEAVVILSTHIVEDVADLCSRMAVFAGGRVALEGEPEALIRSLDGRVWSRIVSRDELPECRTRHEVISTRLVGGRTRVHVLAGARPGPDFEPEPGSLGDVYFATLSRLRRAA